MTVGESILSNEKTKLEVARQALQREFESTFINDLMPGILHNFANPLNGIMGRSRLLERRLNDYLKKTNPHDPEWMDPLGAEQTRLLSDIASICKESDRFFYMFQDLASKFYAVADRRLDQINLEDLIRNEIRFLDFYLDFKHEVKKTVKPAGDLPFVYGVLSDYSYCFSALFRDAMGRMKRGDRKELSIEMVHTHPVISVSIEDTGAGIDNPADDADSAPSSMPRRSDGNFAYIKTIFDEYGINCLFEGMEDRNRITIEFPVTKK